MNVDPIFQLESGKESLEEAVLACIDPDQLQAKGLIKSRGSQYKQVKMNLETHKILKVMIK